jgi:hypothetical protein
LLLFLQQHWFLVDTSSDRLAETKRNTKLKKFWFQFNIVDITYPFIASQPLESKV